MIPLLVALGVIGLMIGSFLNVCISRLPAGQSIVSPGSRCPKCGASIRWFDNIPLVSYLILGGRCRACRAPISVRYPLVELATVCAFIEQGLVYADDWPRLIMGLVFSSLLIALFVTDLETQRLPNLLTLGGTVIGILFSIWLPPGLGSSLVGASAGAAVLFAIRWAWKRHTGVEGMGLGDVKMAAMIGAFVGPWLTWLVLFLSSIVGAVAGIALVIIGGRSMQSRIPFGTFLALSAFVVYLFGDRFLAWYLGGF